MSHLGPRTKKVTTYGKKRTGVVALYTDNKFFTPTKSDDRSDDAAEKIGHAATVSPTRPKRAPLTSKLSNDNVNVLTAPTNSDRRTKKGSKTKDENLFEGEGFFVDDVVVKPPAKALAGKEKKLPKDTVKKAKKGEIPRQKGRERFDGVEIAVSKPARRSSPTVIDVVEEVASLSLEDASSTPDHQADLDRLVRSATLPAIHDFSTFLASPAVLSLLAPEQQAAGTTFRKIGEASYSEVFAMSIKEGKELVVKVIPLHDPDHIEVSASNEKGEKGTRGSMPDTSYPGDVLRELEITARMCELPGGGFIDFLGSYVVKGSYPQALVDEWWSFKRTLGSASVCPDKFGDEQCYALVVLADGGLDLETFRFDAEYGWKQAAGVFWQTVDALARAEAWTSFEHRDLHEGQILISQLEPSCSSATAKSNYLSPGYSGAKATIIDFGLSRLAMPDNNQSTWSAFPPEVYEGKGDQWDVYRSIKDMVGEDWQGFHPRTNVLWLQYLLRYLLHRTKSLRRPKLAATTRARRARAPRKSDIVDQSVMSAYTCLTSTETWLTQQEPASAQEIMAWGQASGFLG